MTILINGCEYELATTLRVAYKVQGQHNHMPYTEVFSKIGEMVLEDQVGIVYAAFECANAEASKFLPRNKFLDAYLDTYTIRDLMEQIKAITDGIMGISEPITEESADACEEVQGN